MPLWNKQDATYAAIIAKLEDLTARGIVCWWAHLEPADDAILYYCEYNNVRAEILVRLHPTAESNRTVVTFDRQFYYQEKPENSGVSFLLELIEEQIKKRIAGSAGLGKILANLNERV